MSATRVHLVRHGEVANPHGVVYADLPGYRLSAAGATQAAAAATYLAGHPIRQVVTSPLLRATQTAQIIAAQLDLTAEIDPELTEWRGSLRWAGVRWDDLEEVFPGELTAYMETPYELPFAPESIRECGARVAATTRRWADRCDSGDLVVVSHQDPIHAGHHDLIGVTPALYHAAKPAHAAVITLNPTAGPWVDHSYFAPEQGPPFPPLD